MSNKVEIGGVTYEIGDSRRLIDVDKDLAWHGGSADSESWFIVANLHSGGDRIGLQVQTLIKQVPEVGPFVSINVSLINEATGWYKSFEYVYPADQVSIATDAFDIEAPRFKFAGTRSGITTYVEFDDAVIDIHSRCVAPVLLTNGLGYMEFLDVDQYEFAFPRMETTGGITMGATDYEVTGMSWFDRQWGDQAEYFSHGAAGEPFEGMQWLWINPQLSNGMDMSIGQTKQFDKNVLTSAASFAKPDGTHILAVIDPIEEYDYWVSPVTGNRYPTRIVVRAPGVGCVLTVEVPFKEQEIVSEIGGLTKYEGAALVTGTVEGEEVSGECYLELVGHWR